jgi:DNA-3-methyladenine glycosylase
MSPLDRSFYARPTLTVARELLGKRLLRRRGARTFGGRIVEVEAYLGERDQASHARRGPTPRAEIMFGPPGFAYVYLIYGMHHCMNVVCEEDGTAGAVLLRALEPLDARHSPTDGPGKLCAALAITRDDNGTDLCGDQIWIADAEPGDARVRRVATPRIGVEYAGAWAERPYRFVDADSEWLSRPLPKGSPCRA